MKLKIKLRPIIFFVILIAFLHQKAYSQCSQIESILVDACDTGSNEGFNEMVRFKVGATAINTSNLTVSWPSNTWRGLIQNATTVSKVATLNAQITAAGGCGQLIEPTGGVIPANAKVILVSSFNFNVVSNYFGAISDNIYIIFQNNPTTTGGHFANYTSTSSTRTLTMFFGGGCSDSVAYQRNLLKNINGSYGPEFPDPLANSLNDGATVNFTPSGTASYINNGCVAPVEIFSVDAGNSPINACAGSTISLTGIAQGHQSVIWSALSGSFSSSNTLATNYTIDSAATGTITLTLQATNSCGIDKTDTVLVNVTPGVLPTFTAVSPICPGDVLAPLPTTSNNSITGTWSPALDNTTTTTYTFTPTVGQCASTTTLTINVGSGITPTFTTIVPICSGDALAPLPTTSNNSITGTWFPALDNRNTTTYTFTPTVGQCASTTTLTINVSPAIVPTFTAVTPICSGETLVPLPTTSNNSITGTWSPALDNRNTTTYTFTPTTGQCSTTTTMTITVNSIVIPTFTAVAPICSGESLSALPTTSNNSIIGTWSPALDNRNTTTYTFTPTSGQCATTTALTINVAPGIVPTFTAIAPICSGEVLSALSTTSNNSITGTWSPALDNTTTTVYTFTPTLGQCASTTTLTINVSPAIVPTFTALTPICSGETLAPLPTTSNNSITGTWSPALDNSTTTIYTFTPTAGQCATTTTMTITVNSIVIPTFTAVAPICSGEVLAPLPTTSNNSITGTWSPALDNSTTTIYTFTPTVGQCATTTTLTINVSPAIVPTFTAVSPICSGESLSALPTTSNNSITGTWSPALDNRNTTTYTFTPTSGQCATTTTLTINVSPAIVPTFTAVAPICSGGSLSALPTTSNNSITGTWSPALDNTTTTVYTFTPTSGQCATTTTLTIVVNSNEPTDKVYYLCSDETGQIITPITIDTHLSSTDYSFIWEYNSSSITETSSSYSTTSVGVYTVTATSLIGGCSRIFNLLIKESKEAIATASVETDFNNQQQIVVNVIGGLGDYNYQLDDGLPQKSPVFEVSKGGEHQIKVIDKLGCNNFTLNINVLNYPRFFTPNNDGYNDTWNVDGLLHPEKAVIYIFDRYGKLLKQISPLGSGWNGTYGGKQLPSTDYWFQILYEEVPGNKKEFKAHFSLKR